MLVTLALGSCNITKHLPPGEKLYVGSEVKMQADSTISKSEVKTVKASLEGISRPRPAKTLLGYPYKVALYYAFGTPKKETGLRASLRRKLGEPPVLSSAKALGSSATIMTAFLENEGYFRSAVSGSLAESGYKAKGVYQVKVAPRYTIDSVAFLADSTPIKQALFFTSPRTLLKAGDPYRFAVIKAERDRISDALKRRGFFYFLPDYVTFLADSAVGKRGVKLYVAVKPDMPDAAGVPYFIRNIYIYPNYSLVTAPRDTNRQAAYKPEPILGMNQFQIVDSARLYNPKLFDDIVSLRSGQRYNSRAQDLTLSRFINVGTFKFVRNRFDPVQQSDSALLDVHYYLTPYPKKTARVELAGTSRSNNLTGSQLTLSWRNRNTLHRAELLTINLIGGIEFQVGAGAGGVTNYRYGADATLSFPRLVTPFRTHFFERQLLPKTNATLGYSFIVRGGLYDLNSFQGAFGYAFKPNQRTEHSLQVLSANYVYALNFGDRFYQLLAEDPSASRQFLNILTPQLILSSLYTLNYNSLPQSNKRYSNQMILNIEPAGNLAGLFVRKDSTDQRTLFKVPFAQYVRMDVDTRHYIKLAPGLTWANRAFAGVGVVYGNSPTGSIDPQLPFIKQYFVGGSNSLRGFRPRAVGPGIFSPGDSRVLFQDGGGDVKLEANTELRPKFNNFLQGALFLDAGNVWMFKDESTYGIGSKFSKDFINQVAVSAGVGLRLDLSYFLIRLDLATPLRKPWLPDGERWVTNQINLRDPNWRKKNLVLNIAIGYPF